MVQIGLMGCGTVAGYGHLPAIAATPGLQLVALFDPDRQHLESAGTKYAVPHLFQDPEEFMSCDLDVVAVTSPAPAHYENVLLAARHGKHVLCEKPLAMTDQQAEEMLAAMNRAKKLLLLGFTYRFSPLAQQIKQLIADDAIGPVKSARLVYIWDCHGKYATRNPGEKNLNMRRHHRMLEGGPLVDCGVHQIDLARWWLNSEVTHFTAHGAWVDDYEAPDHTWLHMDHASGAHVLIENSYSYGHTARQQRTHYVFECIGPRGVIRCLRDNETFELWTPTEMKKLPWHGEKNFEGMYAQLVQSIRSNDPANFATGHDGLIATQIARRATEMAIQERQRLSQR